MARHAARVVLGALRRETAGVWAALSDRELLRRFAETSDQDAFAALFHRHAALVLGVCQRALTSPEDAEDACQATFLVLARKAKTGRWEQSVANWLYVTARKVAANARAAARRRSVRESRAAVPKGVPPVDAMTSRELLAALDEELDRLPPRYREPLVLCYLEGLTRDEAARRLGVPEGTLKIRLERGRKRLAGALTGRGHALGAGLLALAATSASKACLPCRVEVAVAMASGAPSAAVAALAEEVVAGGVLKKALLATLAAVAALAVGIASVVPPTEPVQPEKAPGVPAALPGAEPVPPAPGARTDLFGDVLPPGALARFGTVRFRAGMWPKHLAASPDGRKLATAGHDFAGSECLTVWDVGTGRPLRQTAMAEAETQNVCWLGDGRGFAVVKVSRADYVVWEFTDAKAPPPRGDYQEIHTITNGTFTASAISPDGRWLAGGERAGAAGNTGRLAVWALVPNRPVREAEPRLTRDTLGAFVGLAFTPDGTRLVGLTQRREPDRPGLPGRGMPAPLVPGTAADLLDVYVWDPATGKELLTFNAPAGLRPAFALAPDSRSLYTASRANRITAFDLATGKERFGFAAFPPPPREGPSAPVRHLGLTADGQILLAVQDDTAVAGFDARAGRELWRSQEWGLRSVNSFAVLPDGKRFVIGGTDGALQLCDAASGRLQNEMPGHRGAITAVALADGGRTAVTCAIDGSLRRWDLASGKEIGRTATPEAVGFRALGFAPDLRTVLGVRALEGPWTVGLLDTATGQLSARPPLDGPGLSQLMIFGGRPLAWLPDGSVVVPAGPDAALRVSRDGREMQKYRVPAAGPGGGGREVKAVAASPDGQVLVLAGTGRRTGIARAPGWVCAFDARTGKAAQLWESPTQFVHAAFTPDGASVVLAGDTRAPDQAAAVVLFDVARGEGTTPFELPSGASEFRGARALAVAPTGYQIAIAEWDHTVTVYETASGAIRRQLRGHRNAVEQLAFTPDGLRLVSISRDLTGLVWDVGPPRPPAAIVGSDADRRRCWEALGATDAGTAFRALGELAADPAGAVAIVRANLKPAPAPSDADVDRLITRLDGPTFAERQAALKELDALGGLAVPRVRDRLRGTPTLEVRRRLETFLQRHDRRERLTGPRLRERRAVELLEAVNTPEARALLKALATGGNTPLARDAAAATKRLGAE